MSPEKVIKSSGTYGAIPGYTLRVGLGRFKQC